MFYESIKNIPGELYSRIEELILPPNEIILEQDTEPRYLYVVVKGSVKVYHTNTKGQEFLFGLYGQGEIFGELEYFNNIKYFSSVETISESIILRLSKVVFEKILEEKPELYKEFCSSLSERLFKLSQRTTESSYYPLEILLAKFFMNEMKDANTGKFNVNKDNLAGYFGTNVRSINRIIKKFSDTGIISLNGSMLFVNNPGGLEEIYKQY